ncbi:MAG: hypothetical protein ABJF10_00655 [Chthoniobacter sp.]
MSDTAHVPSPERSRRWMEILGFIVIAFLLYSGVREYWQHSRASYGPPQAEALDLIVAPGLLVEILPSAGSLRDEKFAAFDVSPEGDVLVSIGPRVVEMESGEDVFTEKVSVHSFAFVRDALAVIDMQGRLGFLAQGKFETVGDPPVPHCKLLPSTDHTRLFFLREGYDNGNNIPALLSMNSESEPEILTGSFSALQTAGGDMLQTYFSDRHALFRILAPGSPSFVFVLPDSKLSITGIVVAGTVLYFASEKAVYVLQDGIAVPLVIGLGGALRMAGGSLYVLEPEHGRVYRITPSKR